MSDTPYRGGRARQPSEDDGRSVEDRMPVTVSDPETATDGEDDDETGEPATASPLADELGEDFVQRHDPVDNDEQDSLDSEPPTATDDEGNPLTKLTEPEPDTLGEIVDWRYTDRSEEWVVLQTTDEQVQRKPATPEQTVQDWVALIRNGDTRLSDVQARPYQDWTDDQMQQRVDAELRGGRDE